MAAKFTISSLYLPAGDDLLLKAVLATMGSRQNGQWRYNNQAEQSDAVIVNLDDSRGRAQWKQLKQAERTPLLIAYTEQAATYPSQHTLAPSMQPETIRNLLAMIQSQLSSHNTQSSTAGVKVLFKSPQLAEPNNARAKLIDVLLQHHKEPLLVENDSFRVVLDCAAHTCYGGLSYAELLLLLQRPCKAYTIKILTPEQKQFYTRALPQTKLNDAVWTVIMAAAFNNHSAEPICPDDTPLMLEAWPNFQALPHLPEHISITTCLSQGCKTPRQLAMITNTSLKLIQPFINACVALGYMAQASETKLFWHNDTPAIVNDKPENLLSRLRHSLLTPNNADVRAL